MAASSPILSPTHRRQLLALADEANEHSRQRGVVEDLVYDGFVALMGEGAAAPRRTRAWATPEWCAGECPGCARQLRLLLVPTLDVIKCIYCQTASYACLSQTARTTENNKNHDDTILPVEPPQPPSLTLRFSGTGRGSWKVQGGRGSGDAPSAQRHFARTAFRATRE